MYLLAIKPDENWREADRNNLKNTSIHAPSRPKTLGTPLQC